MFSRIFGFKNFTKLTRYILLPHNNAIYLRSSITQTSRYLHLKVYDKDAEGLDAKRAANKFTDVEHEMNQNILSNSTLENFGTEGNTLSQTKNLKSTAFEFEDDPDVFGTATEDPIEEDEGDAQEEEYMQNTHRSKRLQPVQYARMIKDHLRKRQVKEALEVLEIRMLKEDRVKPDTYIYNLLISGCARAGYTRKAFNLFTKMRQRGLQVKESTYTSLFNACANAPSREDGLTRAMRLRESLLENNFELNVKNYNVMIKTFGRWGDIQTAFILADEMKDKRLPTSTETYNFLFQACASDEQHGFRHCLLTWHNMLRKNIRPDYYSFNTVLRCVRDCGFGSLDEMENLLQKILYKKITKLSIERSDSCDDSYTLSHSTDKENNSKSIALTDYESESSLQVQNATTILEYPNLLSKNPHLGSMVTLSEVHKPHERFLLLGGLTGFLELMKSYSIIPDIKTFTFMLEVIPPTKVAEKQLLTFMRKLGLKADIDFFNILIKKRAMRSDYEGGVEVLSMISTAGLYPDIVTYGVLALGCTTIDSSRELLETMRNDDIRMNIQILGAMLRQGTITKNFPYVCEIMQISLDENIKPNELFLKHLYKFYLRCARAIDSRHPLTKTKSFKKEHKQFCDKYRLYQEEHGIEGLKLEDAIKRITERPYSQYKDEKLVGIEPLKNEELARKSKPRKHIKNKMIKQIKDDDDFTEKDAELHNSHNFPKEAELHNFDGFPKTQQPPTQFTTFQFKKIRD